MMTDVSPADQAAPIREMLPAPSSIEGSKRYIDLLNEARAALDALVARCEQLEQQRDALTAQIIAEQHYYGRAVEQQERAEAAEDKVEQLEQERDWWMRTAKILKDDALRYSTKVEQLEQELTAARDHVSEAEHAFADFDQRADRLETALRDIAIEVVAARKTLDAYGTLGRISEIVGAALEETSGEEAL